MEFYKQEEWPRSKAGVRVAKYIFHLSFQLTGAKLFLSGSFKREGRKATYINTCKHVPHAGETSLRSSWFGKPSVVLPAGEEQRVTHAGILAVLLELKHLEAHPDRNRLVVTQKMDLFYRTWK